jgi:hypothetical protein
MMRSIGFGRPLLAALAMMMGCAPAPQAAPPGTHAGGGAEGSPPAVQQSEFGASHHASVEGVVVGRGGAPLDSVTVVAWRVAQGPGTVAQLRTVTDAAGRFRLPVRAQVGPQQTRVSARVVVRGMAYASRYPRGAEGRVALDSAVVPVTLAPLSQAAPVARARITLPLP